MIPSVSIQVDEQALRALGVRLVVLFGSHARGTPRPDSDVDIGVLLDGGEPARVLDPRRERILDTIHAPGEIDLVVLDRADPLLLWQVACEGRPLFEETPGTYEAFRVRAAKRYYDTAWLRKIEADKLRERYG